MVTMLPQHALPTSHPSPSPTHEARVGPPIFFLYLHFHNSIRSELESLAAAIKRLESGHCVCVDRPKDGCDVHQQLLQLKERYLFMEQIYSYHSSVEDEVVYPALDSKVKNVTVAYSVEHRDEELLFEQLSQLLTCALACQGAQRHDTIRKLMCKVEEIHTTLKKHLAKEEEQLLPLLVRHFSYDEQAELIAQFLYSIPLITVDKVLAWLKPTIPEEEQEQLLLQIRSVVPDSLLLQLLSDWLQPSNSSVATAAPSAFTADAAEGVTSAPPTQQQPQQQQLLQAAQEPGPAGRLECCGDPLNCRFGGRSASQHCAAAAAATARGSSLADAAGRPLASPQPSRPSPHAPCPLLLPTGSSPSPSPVPRAPSTSSPAPSRAPIKDIAHIHRSIRSAVEGFVSEARALQQTSSGHGASAGPGGGTGPGALGAVGGGELGGAGQQQQQQGGLHHSVSSAQVSSLVERHRFLRSVCLFHTASEETVMYPELRRLSPQHEATLRATQQCSKEHDEEVTLMEDLGRLLADVRAYARRGRKEVSQMLDQLCAVSERLAASIAEHMCREERELFPLLERSLCPQQQCSLLWRTLQAMPLRLLERVMPWIVAGLSNDDVAELLTNVRLGAPSVDSVLVQLLSHWAWAGRAGGGPERPGAGEGGEGAGDAEMAKAGLVGEREVTDEGQAATTAEGSGRKQARHGSGWREGSTGLRVLRQSADSVPEAEDPCLPVAKRQRQQWQQQQQHQSSDPDSMHHSCQPLLDWHQAKQAPSSAREQQQQRQQQQQQQHPLQPPLSPSSEALFAPLPPSALGQGQWRFYGACCSQHRPKQQQQHSLQPRRSPSSEALLPPLPPLALGQGQGRVYASCCPQHQGQQPGRRRSQDGSDGLSPIVEGSPTTSPQLLHLHTSHSQPHSHAAHAHHHHHLAGPLDLGAHTHCSHSHQHGTDTAHQHHGSACCHDDAPPMLTNRISSSGAASEPCSGSGTGPAGGDSGSGMAGAAPGGFNPIDHIFQFHRALRLELRELEGDADALQEAVLAACGGRQAQPAQQQQQAQQQAQQQQAGAAESATSERAAAQAGVSEAVAQRADPGGVASSAAAPTVASPSASSMPRTVVSAVQQLGGRFQFLWGIYRAHSRSEDEIVFPALESKHALRNVSHAYTLDHQQEEQLFFDLDKVLSSLKMCTSPAAARSLTFEVRRMCAAIRASLETHVRSEESELWPLFAEHFSVEEQQYLVGVIIGRTGAQVLQTLLPWISDSFSSDEKEEMMESLRLVTKNTMFDQWLGAVNAGGQHGQHHGQQHGHHGQAQQLQPQQRDQATAAAEGHGAAAEEEGTGPDLKPLIDVAEYLASGSSGELRPDAAGATAVAGAGMAAVGGAASVAGVGMASLPSQQQQKGPFAVKPRVSHHHHHHHGAGTAAAPVAAAAGPALAANTPCDATTFRPGWEDIFRMNQKQLEAAIHRVSNDISLEPERKAYLIQYIMVSRYIVAQQKRMRATEQAEAAASAGEQAGGSSTAVVVAPSTAAAALPAVAPAVERSFHAPGVLGCPHYQRKCQLVSPCCDKVYTCRLCHDESSSHRMDRYSVEEMVCMECNKRQPVAQNCGSCGAVQAHYYCSICHLFDDDPSHDIYHCPFCNVCRRGRGLGVDFFHCMTCNACMALQLFASHVCREKAMEGDCPVCSERLFDSSQPIKELPCGHLMHSSCFAAYTRYNYTCPLCTKSIGDMTVYFQMLDSLLASERLPAEYAGRTQMILCNDCGKSGFAPFHFVYHSCPHCRSYNTRVT